MSKIRIGIVGYGNLGKGVEASISQNDDMELSAVFTRRDPMSFRTVTESVPVLSIEDAEKFANDIDVMILCGGSSTDLPLQGPHFAKLFNTVDSFDTHAKIPDYFSVMDKAAKESKKVSVISIGWDPGLFSLSRMLFGAVLPVGDNITFWGKGVSQGHSDAIRRVKGVKAGVQYTIPIEQAVEAARLGCGATLTTRDKHLRECFVVAEQGANLEQIEEEIKNMPNYFSDYNTIVNFITEEELKRNHSNMPHGGFVIRHGNTAGGKHHTLEFSLKLDSNPEFTSSCLVAYARAAYKMSKEGKTGAFSIFDVPPVYLSPKSAMELMGELL